MFQLFAFLTNSFRYTRLEYKFVSHILVPSNFPIKQHFLVNSFDLTKGTDTKKWQFYNSITKQNLFKPWTDRLLFDFFDHWLLFQFKREFSFVIVAKKFNLYFSDQRKRIKSKYTLLFSISSSSYDNHKIVYFES